MQSEIDFLDRTEMTVNLLQVKIPLVTGSGLTTCAVWFLSTHRFLALLICQPKIEATCPLRQETGVGKTIRAISKLKTLAPIAALEQKAACAPSVFS